MNFAVKFAGVALEVNHTYNFIKELCRDYLTEEKPLFCVCTTADKIQQEFTLTEGKFPIEVCEATCLHREIVKNLVQYGIILIHSAVVSVDGKAFVFIAKSGVGKSTHIRLWKEMYGERVQVVNGDKPFFSFEGDMLYVHGSAWRGKEMLGENVSVPVGAFCILERGAENVIRKAQSKEAVDRIFHQVLLPDNAKDLAKFMGIMDKIIKTVPFYHLSCNTQKDAANVSYEGMKGEVK